MSFENILLCISIFVDALLVSGALGALIKFGTRISVLEALNKEKSSAISDLKDKELKDIREKQDEFAAKQGKMEVIIGQLEALIPDIHRLAAMSSTLATLTEGIRANVPRSELDAKFGAIEQRCDSFERKLERFAEKQ